MALHSPLAEITCIGLALTYDAAREELSERVKSAHFAEPVLGEIWALIIDGITSPALIMQRMGESPAFREMGGVRFLADAVDKAPPPSAAAETAEAVIDAWTRRILAETGKELQSAAEMAKGTAEAVLHDAERALAEIARHSHAKPAAASAGLTALDMLESAYLGEFAGQPTGVEALDHVTGGIRQDDLWFIGGRTSMGKSVCAVALARAIASQNLGVLFFSLEMPFREVQARLIADAAFDQEQTYTGGNVRYGDILKGRGDAHHRGRARDAAKAIASLPLNINDTGGLTISEIKAQTLRQFRAWEKVGIKPGAVIIDHVGLVQPERKTDNKAADTADIVNELKPLAKAVGTPVIALVQVNRQTEGRNDKRPTMGDLNWSGAIEQAGDLICLLYRDSYYLLRSSDENDQRDGHAREHDLEMIIAKNRQGPICTVHAYVDVACNAVRSAPEAA